MLNHFTFNGHSTGELGLLVSGINIYGSPSRIVEKVTIPYRSGDLIMDTGAYTNYMLTYTVDIMDNTKATAEAISKWLLGSKGYCELTDTYNPEIYRVASYYNQLDYTLSALYRYGKATITFDCKPQKYLTANQPVTLTPTTSEATSYSLSTPAMPLPLTLEGNTTQGADPTPDAPQEIHSVSGDNEIRVVGFNLWDEEWEVGTIGNSGENYNATDRIRGKNYISVTPNATYYYYINSTYGIYTWGYDANKTYVGRVPSNGYAVSNNTVTIPSNVYFIRIVVQAQYGTTYKHDICINVSSSRNGEYEPYKAQVYPINLPVENLYNAGALTQGTTYGITLTVSGGTLTFNGTATANTYYTIRNTGYSNGTYTFSFNNPVVSTGVHISFRDTGESYFADTNADKVNKIRTITGEPDDILLYISSGTTLSNYKITPQLEVGSKANSYTPYGVAPIELNALSTFKDYIHKENGKWYLHKAFGKADLGSLTWARRTTNIFSSSLPTSANVSGDVGSFMSNYFIVEYAAGYAGTNPNKVAMYKTSSTTSTTTIYLNLSSVDTVADLTTWFSTNATELVYPLATPTETEITDATLISQLNALSKAKTYEGATNIVQDGNDAEFKLSMPVPAEISSEHFGEPIITVNETGTIVWNDSLIKVNSAPVTINSQTLQCYYYSENKNNDVEINEFPKYEQGDNYIGSTMALTVVPNYWKL